MALAAPTQPTAVTYTLRWGAHNGRCFVGPLQQTKLAVQPNLGCQVLAPQAGEEVVLDWLPQDVLVVMVLQLLAAPAQVRRLMLAMYWACGR